MDGIILTKELTKRFGDVLAVDHVNLEISKGEIFGLLGPNGSGKTTIVRMLCGLMTPSYGTAIVAGYDVYSQPDRIKERIGYMPQRFCLYEDHTAFENLEFYSRIYGLDRSEARERINDILGLVQLNEMRNRSAGILSGGLKQRLALACALVHGPRLVFLDEPTAGVDPPLRRIFWDYFRVLNHRGITVFVNTHYMDEATQCSRLGILREGKLVAVGSPDELRRKSARKDIVQVLSSDVHAAERILEKQEYVDSVKVQDDWLRVTVAESESAIPRITSVLEISGITVRQVKVVEATLEDAFMSLTGEEGS